VRTVSLPFLVLLPAACVVAVHDDTDEILVAEAFDRVVVDLDAGGVILTAGEGGDVVVVADLTWVGQTCPSFDARVRDGVLVIDGRCDGTDLGWCSVDVEAAVPPGLPVEVRTGAGDVVLERAGEVDVETGSGDVGIEGAAGSVRVETGSGDVSAWGIAGRTASFTSGSGDLVLRVVGSFEQVIGETGSGDVDLEVPAGAYLLDLDTGSGDVEWWGVDDDPGAGAAIWLRSGSGDITVTGR
jgi:hypothetical protein